jgi:pyruvate/2-oxoglutarate dehydrogenase complex dihydrolipoamide acyltransferase (E2) component
MAQEEGRQVSSGDVIAEIETDKATMEVEAVDEGVIGKILVPEGTEGVKVNTVIAVLLEEGEERLETSARRNAANRLPAVAPTPKAEAARTGPAVPAAPVAKRCRSRRSPDSRRHRDGVQRPCAKRCAMPWPRRCAAMTTSS